MTTTADTGLGLDWVTAAGHDQPCGVRVHTCTRQATHAGVFQLTEGNCVNFRERIPYCLVHGGLLLEKAARTGNRFRCCWEHYCAGTSVRMLFVRLETLR